MKKELRESAKILVIGIVAMLALPAAYRIWVHCHPEPAAPRRTLSEFLAKVADERTVRLLRTPVSRWTEGDRKAEPLICAWLEAHSKVVLPWEWTDEARQKDPDGYRKLWLGLFDEQRETLERCLSAEQGRLKSVERELWVAEAAHAHRSNGLVRVMTRAAKQALSLTLNVEQLSEERDRSAVRAESLRKLLARNESLRALDKPDDALFMAETCRFLNARDVR